MRRKTVASAPSDARERRISARLVDETPHRRRLALAELDLGCSAALYALRSVLARDDDATLRARAAERLRAVDPSIDAAVRGAIEEALAGALQDRSALVREAASRTLGTLAAAGAMEALCDSVRADPEWKVRRAAARSLARIVATSPEHSEGTAALIDALDDPFWRVRYAAIQALAGLESASRAARSCSPKSARQAAAIAYLGAIERGEVDGSTAPHEPVVVTPDPADVALGDDDPAVVAARIFAASPEQADGGALVLALSSPHASLRRAAIRALCARARSDEITAALAWLDEPKILYAAGAARRLLSRARSRELVTHVLGDAAAGKSARAWALEQVVKLDPDPEGELLKKASTDAAPIVRRAALRGLARLGDKQALLDALVDPDEATRASVIEMLAPAIGEPSVQAALSWSAHSSRGERVRTSAAMLPMGALLSIVREGAEKWSDAGTLLWMKSEARLALSSPWTWARAEAAAILARLGDLSDALRETMARDPDPWIRESVLNEALAITALTEDPDPFVRRAAASIALVPRRPSPKAARAKRGRGRGAERPPEKKETPSVPSHCVLAAASDDAVIRARCAAALDERAPLGLTLLLQLSRDPSPMVRAAAADRLDHLEGNAECMRLVLDPATPEDLLLAAHARLAAQPTEEGFQALASAIQSEATSAGAKEALRAIGLVYPDNIANRIQLHEPAPGPGRILPDSIDDARASETTSGAPGAVESAPPARAEADVSPRRSRGGAVEMRPLGDTGMVVAPLGLSGASGISPAGLEEARRRGVNLFFWEPRYRAMTEMISRSRHRREMVIVAGSYEADARSIERDADRALRRLRVDTIGVMLLFWVRSRARLEEGAYEALCRLKERGKVRAIGFSTHLRDLAESAICAQRWDVLMCRLSAVHPGAERSLLPAAKARGVGVIAFSALCYGRLLSDPNSKVKAADGYRYALSQPGVSVCLSAPRRWRELEENLTVLDRSLLPPSELERLRAIGERARAENQAFSRLVHRA